MRILGYIESPDGGTRHVWFGGDIPIGWQLIKDVEIPGPQKAVSRKDIYDIAVEVNTVAELLAMLKIEAAKGRAP